LQDLRWLEAPKLLQDVQGDKTQLQREIREAWLHTSEAVVRSNREDSVDLLSQTFEFARVDWQKREHEVWGGKSILVASDQMSCARDGPLNKKVERLISEREKQQRTRYPPSEDLIKFRMAQLLLVPHVHVKRYKGISKLARFEDSKDEKRDASARDSSLPSSKRICIVCGGILRIKRLPLRTC